VLDPRFVHFSISVLSWQEPQGLNGPGNQSYALLSTNTAFNPGVSFEKDLTPYFGVELGLSMIYAKSDLGVSSGKTVSPIQYSAKGAQVFGAGFSFGVWYKIDPTPYQTWIKGTAIGARLPVIYRRGTWPEPSGGYSLDAKSAVYSGLMFQAAFEASHLRLLPQVGFIRSVKHLIWGLELGYGI
jgi:hypothetical protein